MIVTMIGLTRTSSLALVLVSGCTAETTIDHSPLNSPWTIAPVADSLITNGSFENGLAGWSTWYGPTALSSSGQRSGSGCLTIGPDAATEIQDVAARLQIGHDYHLSGYIQISSTAQVNNIAIGMYGTDSSGNHPLNNAVPVASYTSSYQRISMDFQYPANLVQAWAYAQIQDGTGAVGFVDDLQLFETSPSGTAIPPASQIVDSTGKIWTVTSGVIDVDGSPAGYSANVILLLYYNDVIYQENSSSQWFSWTGTTWVDASDPRP